MQKSYYVLRVNSSLGAVELADRLNYGWKIERVDVAGDCAIYVLSRCEQPKIKGDEYDCTLGYEGAMED